MYVCVKSLIINQQYMLEDPPLRRNEAYAMVSTKRNEAYSVAATLQGSEAEYEAYRVLVNQLLRYSP